jgi:hypothetical protein
MCAVKYWLVNELFPVMQLKDSFRVHLLTTVIFVLAVLFKSVW